MAITAPPAARTVTLSIDGQEVALGPAISVLGLERGGTEARPHPRPERPPDQAAGASDDGAPS